MPEVTLRLSPRQRRLLESARAVRCPDATLEAYVADAFARTPAAERARDPQPAAAGPRPSARRGLETVAPGRAAELELPRGRTVRIEQIAGGQCVDVVAWSLEDGRERLSAARTRALAGCAPSLGDRLWSGPPYERPLLRVVADSAPGHDLLFPACSALEYAAAGCEPEPSCAAVQQAAAARHGVLPGELPDPLNLWLRGAVGPDGALSWRSTPTRPGDHVELRALVDLLVVVNPCVDDVFGCSGLDPGPVRVGLLPAARAGAGEPEPQPASRVAGRPRRLRRRRPPPSPRPAIRHELRVTIASRMAGPADGLAARVRRAAVGDALEAVRPALTAGPGGAP